MKHALKIREFHFFDRENLFEPQNDFAVQILWHVCTLNIIVQKLISYPKIL